MNAHVKEFAAVRDGVCAALQEPEPRDLLAQPGRVIAYAGMMAIGGFIGLIVGVIAAAMLGLITVGC